MELRHLRYFVAAVEETSLQRAAQRMSVAQPALSRRIRDLEQDLGCELLERNPRGVTPTPAGAALYRDALALLEGLDEAGRRARRIGVEQGRHARLGIVHSARKYGFLSRAVLRASEAPAPTGVELVRALSPELARTLREGRLDMTLLYERRLGAQGFGERLIHRERYVLTAAPGHRLAGAGPLPLSALAGEPLVWLSRQEDADGQDRLLQQCRLQGLEPAVARVVLTPEEQIDFVAVGGGLCLTPASTLLATPPDLLCFRPLPDFELELPLSLAWRHDLAAAPAALLGALNLEIDRHQEDVSSGRLAWTTLQGHPIALLEARSSGYPFRGRKFAGGLA